MPAKSCPCGGVRKDGKCSRCSKVKSGKKSSTERGYDWTWQKFRKQYLTDSPLCLDCLDRGDIKPAVDLHHIKKLADYPELRLDPDNIMPLCKRCHGERTKRGE